MAWYRCGGGSGSGRISSTVRLTETEWEALSNKDNSTIYYVTNANGDMVLYTYQGSERILNYKSAAAISDYEFWYEDLKFPRNMDSTDYAYSYYWLDHGIKLNSTENLGRSWQLEFNVSPENGTSRENAVIGTSTSDDQNIEIYMGGTNNAVLYLYGKISATIQNARDKDIVIKFENNVVTVTVDGTLTSTINYTPTVDNNNYFVVANYRNNYCYSGYMNYIGFKWLS